jgi:hypothetical protein
MSGTTPDAPRRWARDWPTAMRMAVEGKSPHEIGAELRRSADSVRWKLRHEGIAFVDPTPQGTKRGKIAVTDHGVAALRISEEQKADREARYAALQLRTQTQEFFGDPPPGFSALDRKRAQQQQQAENRCRD